MWITIQIIIHQPGVVVFTVISVIKKLRQEDGDFQTSLAYTEHHQKPKLYITPVSDPSYQHTNI